MIIVASLSLSWARQLGSLVCTLSSENCSVQFIVHQLHPRFHDNSCYPPCVSFLNSKCMLSCPSKIRIILRNSSIAAFVIQVSAAERLTQHLTQLPAPKYLKCEKCVFYKKYEIMIYFRIRYFSYSRYKLSHSQPSILFQVILF